MELTKSTVEAHSIARTPTPLLELAIKRAAEVLGAEVNLEFPRNFQLAETAEELLVICEAYSEGSPELP